MSTTSDIDESTTDTTAYPAGDEPAAGMTQQAPTKGSAPPKVPPDTVPPENPADTATSENRAESMPATEPGHSKDSAASESESGSATKEAANPAPAVSRWTVLGMVTVSLVRKFAVPALIILTVAALALAGFLGWQLKKERDIDSAARAATDAARAYGVTLTSVDSNDLDQDFTAVLDGATGEFKDMYTRSSGQLRQLLMDNKATGEGTVLDAAVKSATPTKVEVLLFIDQTVTNAAAPDPRVDRSRVAMTMELVDGRWLASRVYLP